MTVRLTDEQILKTVLFIPANAYSVSEGAGRMAADAQGKAIVKALKEKGYNEWYEQEDGSKRMARHILYWEDWRALCAEFGVEL